MRVIELAWLEGVQPYNRSYLKPIAVGGIAMAAGWVAARITSVYASFPISGIAGIVVTMLAYAVLVLALGISDDERALLSRAFRRLRLGGRRPRGAAPDSP
jgi:hypothetical protein